MIVLVGVFLSLLDSPLRVVPFVFHPFVNGKCRNADARHAEVVRAIVVASLRMRVGPDGKPKLFRHSLNRGIKSRALGAGNFHFFGLAERRHVVKIQIKRNFCRRNRRMFPRYSDPSRPCSSAVTEAKITERRGLDCACANTRASSSRMPQPVALSRAPL